MRQLIADRCSLFFVWQANPEGATLPDFARYAYVAVVCVDYCLTYSQTQSGSTFCRFVSTFDLLESFKNSFKLISGNAFALVVYRNLGKNLPVEKVQFLLLCSLART